jgi:hypothetical protein
MGYLVAAILAYLFLSRSGGLSGVIGGGNVPAQGYVVPPNPNALASTAQTFAVTGQTVGAGLQAAQSSLSTLAQQGNEIAGSIAKALPVAGAVIGAVLSVLQAASAKRAAEAKDENAAVASAVPQWDQTVAVIANLYNVGQLTAGQAYQAIDAAWASFWIITGPRIQPGRNGCQSGAVTQKPGQSFCGGKTYGAACCVGYDDLNNSSNNMKNAIDQTENTGKPSPAYILPVFASKYGGINRPGYTLTFAKSTSLFTL